MSKEVKKTYETLGIIRLSKQVKIDGEKKEILFYGGSNHPVKLPGKYITTDSRIQKALEEDESFNFYYKLALTEQLSKEPEEEEVFPKEAIDEVAKAEDKPETLVVPEITNGQKAKKWLAEKFDVSELSIGNRKSDILEFAEEHGVEFPDWE